MDNQGPDNKPRGFEFEERVRLMRASVINYIYPLVSGVVGLFLVPVILRYLGAEAYGLWIAALGVASVAGFLEMGLGYSLTRQIAAAQTEDARNKIAGFVVTAGNAYLGLGLVGAGLITALGLQFSDKLHLSPRNLPIAHQVFALVGLFFLTDLVVWFTTVVLHGLRRFDLPNMIGVSYVILRAGGIITVLAVGGGIVAVVACQAIASALTALAGLAVIGRLQPQFRMQVGRFDWGALRPHVSFGLTSLLTATVSGVIVQTASILIGLVCGSASVARFYVGQRFPLALSTILWRGAEVIFPAASESDETKSVVRLREMVEVVTRWMAVLALPPCILLGILAPNLLQAWVGEAGPDTVWILRLTSAAVLADVAGAGAMQVVWAVGAARTVLAVVTGVAAINLGLTLVLLFYMGIVGAAWAFVCSTAVSSLVFLYFAARKYQVHVLILIRRSLTGLILPVAACSALAVLIRNAPLASQWAKVILASLVGGAGYLFLFYLLGTREEERVLAGEILSLPAAVLRSAYGLVRRARRRDSSPKRDSIQSGPSGLPAYKGLWSVFRQSRIWRILRRVKGLRQVFYFSLEMWRFLSQQQRNWRPELDELFLRRSDPWDYSSSPLERGRLHHQIELLDTIRNSKRFACALEVGCAEGLFTDLLAPRCESLLAVDLSPVALERARQHCASALNIRFEHRDLRRQPLPGTFDLIVITGVLEYFLNPTGLREVRSKLVDGLRPGGHLLVETTRANPVVENSWWGRRLIRGKWINAFVAQHPAVRVVYDATTDWYAITLYERIG